MSDEILTHDEVVEWLKIPKSTLYKLLNEKKNTRCKSWPTLAFFKS